MKYVFAVLLLLSVAVPVKATETVLVTVSDFKPIVEAVVGDKLSVMEILPPGSDPHHFSLSKEDVGKIQGAKLIILANSEIIEFEKKIKEEHDNVLDFQDYNVSLEDFPGYPRNPHGYWLKPENGIKIAKAVRDRLLDIYPQYEDHFETNYKSFVKRVLESEREAKKMVSELRGEKFVAAIPGVCYIASSLDLEIGAVLLSEGSGFLSGQELQKVKSKLLSGEYAGIIVPEFMKESKVGEVARQLAEDTNSRVIYVRFSMGDVGYETALISNAARIAYTEDKIVYKTSPYIYALAVICLIEAGALFFIRVRK
jgi:ABC-type Zn uptake system ZnuABC Zn-binding protein ZnuA